MGCGLCCDGTLLDHLAVVDESDLGWPLRMLGVELIAVAEPPVFELPCPAVVDGVCTVYDRHRPSACGQYRCDVLESVESGAMSVSVARQVISETKVLRDAVCAGNGDEAELLALVRRQFGARR